MSLGAGGRPGGGQLPVQATVADTYRHVANNLRTFGFLALLPASVRFAAEVFVWIALDRPVSPLSQLTMLLLTTMLMASFSVAWHRFTLLGEINKASPWQFVFDAREALFFLYSLLLMLPVLLAAMSAQAAPEGGSLFPPVLMGLAVFVFIRLSMLLPAIAVDGDRSPRQAWLRTQGQFWRLFAILLLVALPAELLALLLLLLLSGDNAAVTLLARAAAIVLEFAITAIVVTALSLIYRHLSGPPRAVVSAPGPGAAA